MQIRASGAVIGSAEKAALIEVAEEGWFTAGRRAHEFEQAFSNYLGVSHTLLTNSGSSANLLALAALTAPELPRHLTQGDEVITLAAGFPTTVNPIIQLGLVPHFVDIKLTNYNVDLDSMMSAYNPKVKAVILPHTLGNPFDVRAVEQFAYSRGLWLIEDCCDALGAEYDEVLVSNFGDLGTFSFFPAHQITMGEGGAVVTGSPTLAKLVASYRDWGRDCCCDPGQDGSCGNRFGGQWGGLPEGYDHKYVYTHIGYNLRVTEMQAAIGLEQLKRVDEFVEKRRRNFEYLKGGLAELTGPTGLEKFILPAATNRSSPSWFGFPILVVNEDRNKVIRYLEHKGIGTRLMFGGNLTKQPAYQRVNWVSEPLPCTDLVMNKLFWVGVHPGIDNIDLNYMVRTFWEGSKGGWQ